MNNRRALFASAALVPLVLAGCTAGQSSVSVEKVINQIQAILPFVDVLVAGMSIAVPSVAPIVNVVAPYLTQAEAALNSLSIAMSAAAAMPIVEQVSSYLRLALDTISNAVNADVRLAKFGPLVEQAKAVLALLLAFASGVSMMPAAAARPLRNMHIKR